MHLGGEAGIGGNSDFSVGSSEGILVFSMWCRVVNLVYNSFKLLTSWVSHADWG